MIDKDIITERLVIRIAGSGDAQAIFSYRSDADENKYQGWIPESVKEVVEHIERMSSSFDVSDVCYQFVVVNKNTNQLIGDIGVSLSTHGNLQAEIGCTLNKLFQGNGYATEALGAVVDTLFRDQSKHRVVASIDPRNSASINLIERLGFRKEAHLRESYFMRGQWVDDIVYAILRKEWIETQSSK